MVAAAPHGLRVPPPPPSAAAGGGDQRFVMYGVPWAMYVAINDAVGDRPGIRMSYCEGTLELMSPGRLHEDKKKSIARLLETWALVRDVSIHGLGSMTYRSEPNERGAEPDECYYVSPPREGQPPDIAIEVAVSRSAIDKLGLYAGLGVREVWIWQDDRIQVHVLGKAGYRAAKRSKLLPALDLDEMVTFAQMTDQAAAARAYYKRLQKKPTARG